MRRGTAQHGFTLIEMIVATLLLAIGVAGALAAFSSATKAAVTAEGLHTATLLAQRKMSDIEQQASQITGGDQQGDFGDEYPGYHWQETVEATDYQNLFKVTVTVFWGGQVSPNSRAFVTYLSNTQTQQNSSQNSQPGLSNNAGGIGNGGGNGGG